MFTSEELIDLAIQIDTNAEAIYRKALKRTDNKDLLLLLEWLIEEEARHVEWLAALRQAVKKTAGDPVIAEIGRTILLETLGDMGFSLERANFSDMQQTKELMTVTIAFEKDKVRFFELLRPFVEEKEALKSLDTIIAEEKRHAGQLEQYVMSGMHE